MIDPRRGGMQPSGLDRALADAHDRGRRAALADTDRHIAHAVGLKQQEHESIVAELAAQIEALEKQRDELQAQINAMYATSEAAHGRAAAAEAERDEHKATVKTMAAEAKDLQQRLTKAEKAAAKA